MMMMMMMVMMKGRLEQGKTKGKETYRLGRRQDDQDEPCEREDESRLARVSELRSMKRIGKERSIEPFCC